MDEERILIISAVYHVIIIYTPRCQPYEDHGTKCTNYGTKLNEQTGVELSQKLILVATYSLHYYNSNKEHANI